MNWAKQNYDRLLLAIFAVLLLACAGLLLNNVRGYQETFAGMQGNVPQKRTLPVSVDPGKITAEQKKIADPDTWGARSLGQNRRLPLYVSVPYIAKSEIDDKTGQTKTTLVDPYASGPEGQPLHPPVPNAWLIDNNLDMLSQNVLDQDPDGDGFTNLDEFNGKTDPNDPKKHPPYWTKLVLTRFQRIPFRLLYEAGTGPFQVNTLDLDQPTQFLKIGDLVKGTKFKLTKFEAKRGMKDGINKDISEITLTNVETGETIVLPKQTEVDSPTTYAVLTYLWTGKPFAVKKNGEFTLAPEDKPPTAVKYKCVDVNDTEAKIVKEDDNTALRVSKSGTVVGK